MPALILKLSNRAFSKYRYHPVIIQNGDAISLMRFIVKWKFNEDYKTEGIDHFSRNLS